MQDLSSHAMDLAPAPPERYGKYNLLERIGMGGMAEVWRAKTLGIEGFTKDLVVKRILPSLTADEHLVRMFIEEARLTARLQHANIVQIFDFDRHGDTYYLAMELIHGTDLRTMQKACVKAGLSFPFGMSVYMISEALKGLHYAHTRPQKVVHRDVSPHNILVSAAGEIKLSDFGIAKVAQHKGHTQNGIVRGKLAYMSPEQITGQPLDGRTDIYSMGVVLWELLTHRRLFAGPDESEVVRRVRDGIVPPPRHLDPRVPEEAERVVMKMLSADPRARYQTAAEAARDLCALSIYSYEAQAVGELLLRLFPEQKKSWTNELKTMLANEGAAALNSSSQGVSAPRAAPRSNMAGQDQKTQMAELPPEVAARMATQNAGAAPPPVAPPAAPPMAAPPLPMSTGAAAAKTMMAQAPVLPQPTQGAAAAKTMMAQAPTLPAPPPAGSGLAPPMAPPPAGSGLAPPMAPPPAGSGLAPPMAQGQPARPVPQPMTVMSGAGASHAPGLQRPVSPPIPLYPATQIFGAADPAAAGPPAALRLIGGPALCLLVAVLSAMAANRMWPPSPGEVVRGPSLLAASSRVQIITTPPGATVTVDGVEQDDKTPMFIKGDIGNKARVRITMKGHDPYDVVIPFLKGERPPVKVRLFETGKNPHKVERGEDPTAYEDRPGVKTQPEPEEDEDEKGDKGKAQAAGGEIKAVKAGEEDKPEAQAGKKGRKVAALAEVPEGEEPRLKEGEEGALTGKKSRKKKDKAAGEQQVMAKGGKAVLSVLVRPWAIVYVDGKKIKQTPIRDFQLSPGKHTILLVNDIKGKRETVPINAAPGGSYPITRSWE